MRANFLTAVLLLAACKTDKPGNTPTSKMTSTVAIPGDKPQPLLAVLTFKSDLRGPEQGTVDYHYLADAVRTDVLKAHAGVRVMTLENMIELTEADGGSIDAAEGRSEVETGRRLHADLVISGNVLRFGTNYKLDLRLHDTASAAAIASVSASGATLDDLDKAVGPAVDELLDSLIQRQKTIEAAAAAAQLGFPTSGACTGTNYEDNKTLPAALSYQFTSRGDGTWSYHTHNTRPHESSSDGVWTFNTDGSLVTRYTSSEGFSFSGVAKGWQGDSLVETGQIHNPQSQDFPYRITWTRIGSKGLGIRIELYLGKWVPIGEAICSG